jgi:hypothetical protein
LDNVVFRAGKAVALIDFDLASPGCSLWDIACAARLWAPLRPDSYINDVRRDRVLDRFRLFVDSYGLVDADRLRVVDAVAQNHNWCYDNVRNSAAQAISLSLNIGMRRRRSELNGFTSGASKTGKPCGPRSSDGAGGLGSWVPSLLNLADQPVMDPTRLFVSPGPGGTISIKSCGRLLTGSNPA